MLGCKAVALIQKVPANYANFFTRFGPTCQMCYLSNYSSENINGQTFL